MVLADGGRPHAVSSGSARASAKEQLQHCWVLYSMQGESRAALQNCLDIFLELYGRYLEGCDGGGEPLSSSSSSQRHSSSPPDTNGRDGQYPPKDDTSAFLAPRDPGAGDTRDNPVSVASLRRQESVPTEANLSGPHLSSLPDGFLAALARALHRCVDFLYDKPLSALPLNSAAINTQITGDSQFAVQLLQALVIFSRNVDNLAQLANSTAVVDCIDLALTFLTAAVDDTPKAQSVDAILALTKEYIRIVYYFCQCLYDPYSLWNVLVNRCAPNAEAVIVRPPAMHPLLPKLISTGLDRSVQSDDFGLLRCSLDTLGAVLVGSKNNGVRITSEGLVSNLFALVRRKAAWSDAERIQITRRILSCISVIVHNLHEADPDLRQVEVVTVFSQFLQTLRSLAVHDDESVQTKIEMLGCVHDILAYYDRSALQAMFIGVGIFEQLIQITQQGADVVDIKGGMLQAVTAVRALGAILRGSAKCKELFVERIGYRMLLDVLKTICEPSADFVDALLELVVESEEKDSAYLIVANPQAAVMLLDYAAVLRSPSFQLLIIARISELLKKRMHSRIQCAAFGMLDAILHLFRACNRLPADVADSLVKLFEILAAHSIEPGELKELLSLLKKDDEGVQPSYILRLMHSLSVIACNTSTKSPFRYFDIQGDYDGITVPSMRKKWAGPGFTFHAWVCLDDNPLSTSVSADNAFMRRILYSITNNSGGGFEAFFTYDCVLVVAVIHKKEYIALSLTDHPLRDLRWHCLDIIHAPPRRPFGSSTMAVYMDGRLVHTTNMKMPSLSESFTFFRIGAAPLRMSKQPDVLSHITAPGQSPKLPSSPMSPRLPVHELITVQCGTQDHIFGIPVSLKGQLNSICIFHDAILPVEAKELFDRGPNIVFPSDDSSDLANKLFLYYHSNGCQRKHCIDLSPGRQHDGTFTGTVSTAWSLANSLCCVGGLPALLPILEQANFPIRGHVPAVDSSAEISMLPRPIGTIYQVDSVDSQKDDWVVIQKCTPEVGVESNPVAAFLDLVRKILTRNAELQDDALQSQSVAILGHLLTKVEPRFLDVGVLFAVQLLVESGQSSHSWAEVLSEIYQHILFDFRIWIKADFTVRLGHLQYIRKMVKDDKKVFRKKLGVQFFLDTLRMYYATNASTAVLSVEETEILRQHTLGIVQEFICQNINVHEVAALIRFLLVIKDEKTVDDTLQLLLTVLENHNKSDQIYLLLFEPGAADALLCLLLKRHRELPAETKSKIVAIVSHLLRSSKVYEKSKNRLRMLDVEMGGLLLLMPSELPTDFARLYLEQYFSGNLEHPAKYACIIAIFNKLHHATLPLKAEFARKFLYAIYMKPGAAMQIASQAGWYHSLAGLLVETPMLASPSSTHGGQVTRGSTHGGTISDLIDLKSPDEEENVFLEDFVDGTTIMPNDDKVSVIAASEVASSEDADRSSVSSASALRAPRSDVQSVYSDSASTSPSVNSGWTPSHGSVSLSDALHSQRDSFAFLDDTFATDHLSRPESAVDELCTVVLNILSTVMWQGIEGSSSSNMWGARAQVLLSLDMLALNNHLFKKPEELKRRLYEMALQVVISDLKKEPSKVANIENAELVIRLIHDFITAPDLHTNLEVKLSDKLLEDFSSLLDSIRVWEGESADGWSETLQMGMAVLLTVVRCPDVKYCSIVIPKLHYAIQCRLNCSRREVCYILAALNETLLMSIDMSNQEHFSFVIPVLRLILEKWAAVLSTARYLTNLPMPAFNASQHNFVVLQKYFRSTEWGGFISNTVQPLANDYQNSVCKVRKEKMGEFWNEAHDAAMAQLHMRNKAYGESKLKFQQEYAEPVRKKVKEENYRFSCVQQDARGETTRICRKWEELKRYLFRERGPWREGNSMEVPLRMSHYENWMRMRLKLVENLHFDAHTEASNLRDNTAPPAVATVDETFLAHIGAAKEAKSTEQLMEESFLDETDESESSVTGRAPALVGSVAVAAEKGDTVQREKSVLQENCDLITVTENVQGRFELTTQRIKFHAMNPAYDSATGEGYSFEISLTSLREMHVRRYNLRRSAIELFLVDQTNYFLNFTLSTRNEVYKKVIGLKPSGLMQLKYSTPAALFKASGVMQKWVQREMSNLEYLMALNTIAGRTYNDLSQYPVFPWVLRDYTSAQLDLHNPDTFRDFSRPMGIQNPRSIPEVRHKYDNFEDPSGTIEPFHYGQHYSNPASVIHYLLRLEPFTTLHIQLQSGRFDVADRQFHSIAGTWDLLWNNPNDVKELIPEFFYLPEFLVNMNDFDLGCLQQSKERVSDVLLPRWASSAEEFIHLHRAALESEYVSAHLHEWIDLIFGCKQRGQAAVEALNVFYYCTYEGAVDLDAIVDPLERQATEGMINNFGQTPCQLLREPHPRRLTLEEATRRFVGLETPGRLLNAFHYTTYLKAFVVEANAEDDPLVFVAVPKIQTRNLLQQGMKSDLITIGGTGALGLHVWTPYDRNSPKNMAFERDPTLVASRYTRSVAGPFHPSLTVTCNLFAVTADCKLLFYGGSWDNSLRVFNLSKGKTTAQAVHHRDLVTCLALDSLGLHLVTGSRDCTCAVWEVLQQGGQASGLNGKPLVSLYGHDEEVACVALSVELDMVASGARDATIILHTLKHGLFVRTLRPGRGVPISVRNVVSQLIITYDGKVVAGCFFPECREAKHSIQVYSINGKHLHTAAVGAAVTGMAVADDYIVTGDAEGRLEIRECFRLRTVYSMQVSSGVSCISIPRSSSHIFAGLNDGKLIIVTVAPNVLELMQQRDAFGDR
ncbi:neurobeachin-like protein 1 [Paramacrobiotus metropolitanus]|uniref:neurobeachin-like protein 1 n=1 Tax=Paramacrobiotus metropolitanus TaxID=2943436 RepID=UPI002445609D|nr:neurobeachin-like protein 1 [Paramacrobiotus metropolitanus]